MSSAATPAPSPGASPGATPTRGRATPGDFAALFRPRIGLLAAAGTLAGFLTRGPGPGGTGGTGGALLCAAAGALLLSCGASALNQVQERRQDAAMLRTKTRPLPGKRLSVRQALLSGLACLACSGALLAATPGGLAALALVPLSVAVYNGLYTPLKKRTSLAMLVGGLAGALPPVLGCVSAGGSPLEPRALLLAALFYAWQVPHFWLFARLHRADYQAAGFQMPHQGVGRAGARGPLALWIISYGALMLLLPAFGLVSAQPTKWLVTALALALAGAAWPLVSRERLGFALVNASLVLLLVFLAADALHGAA